jgi:AraC family transcriptional regulator, regulatory protein of adaptative response / methylated-DNA-[protein]-cysteine methyltransferase
MSNTIIHPNGKISIHPCEFGYALVYTVNDSLYKLELGSDPSQFGFFFIKKRGWTHWTSLKEFIVSPEKQSEALIKKVLLSINEGIVDPNINILLEGTKFQMNVWSALTSIAVGETASYQEIANRIGNPNSVRAVGTACGNNPIGIIIPCHRVIRSDGSMGQYRWGTEIKNKLLTREKQSLK